MTHNRMIGGLQTRPILGAINRMIVSTPLGGDLILRKLPNAADQADEKTDTDKA